MENIDWNKALTDIVDALRGIGTSLEQIEAQLDNLNEYGIGTFEK